MDIVEALRKEHGLNVAGRQFDFFHPDETLDMPAGSAIFTVGALEQTGTQWEKFLEFVLKKKPACCFHIEPIHEWYDHENNLVDYTAWKAHEVRNFWRGFPGRIIELEKQGRARILKTKRINFGSLVAGGIGSKERFSYTVLGDEVNLAARLESLTRHYPTEVIFSESCYDRLPEDLKAQSLLIDRCTVKGRKSPTGLYTLQAMPPEHMAAYDAALNKYLAGDFLAAESAFNEIPGALAAYMRRRCGQLQVEEGKFWPGYYSWEVK
ncbi:MAG: adenylate/guanylate cyclase domain-containing protein [Verrucomicrobia bacterium]|nr:adenylate/guanylate cyclase domain-containing protein [Verrucomicrobiota bacterium]